MSEIKIESVTCKGCKMLALLDSDGRCEFCRPRPTTKISPDRSNVETFDLFVLAVVVLVLGLLLYFAPWPAG